jgi:hypothetical protein
MLHLGKKLSWEQWLMPVNLGIQEQRSGRSQFQSSLGKKVSEAPSQPIKSRHWYFMPVIPATQES